MSRERRIGILSFYFFFFIVVSYAFSGEQSSKISVVVSIAPQAFFANEIGGDCIDVSIMVPKGACPATYEPRPHQMAAISDASIYFAIGVPFEKSWLKKISSLNYNMTVVDTSDGISKIPMGRYNFECNKDIDNICINNCGQNKNTSKNCCGLAYDPHVWTSPPLVKIIAKNMANTLIELDPKNKKIYSYRLKNFEKKLDKLHSEIIFLLKGKEQSEFMVFHPSWGYFANTYGLTQIIAEVEGKAPKPAQLAKLIKYAIEKKIEVLFVQPQFSTTTAKIITKAVKGRIMFADPLEYDWITNIKKQAIQFSLAAK